MKHILTSSSSASERLPVNSDSGSFQSYSNDARSGEPEYTNDPSISYTLGSLIYQSSDSHTVEATCLPLRITNSNHLDLPTYLFGQKDCIFAI